MGLAYIYGSPRGGAHPALGGGGGAPPEYKVHPDDERIIATVSTASQARNAIASASSVEDIVYIEPGARLEPSGDLVVEDCTLASNRGIDGARGGIVAGDAIESHGDARYIGIRVEGPWPDDRITDGEPDRMGIQGVSGHVAVHNCEIYGFSYAGVTGANIVTHSDIHSMTEYGTGYGVVGSDHYTVEWCTFNFCRHALDTAGPDMGYTARNCWFGPMFLSQVCSLHRGHSGSHVTVENSTFESVLEPDFHQGTQSDSHMRNRGEIGSYTVRNVWSVQSRADATAGMNASETFFDNNVWGTFDVPDATIGHPRGSGDMPGPWELLVTADSGVEYQVTVDGNVSKILSGDNAAETNDTLSGNTVIDGLTGPTAANEGTFVGDRFNIWGPVTDVQKTWLTTDGLGDSYSGEGTLRFAIDGEQMTESEVLDWVPPDDTAPPEPVSMTLTSVGSTTATISWSPPSNTSDVDVYVLFVDGEQVDTVSSGTTYTFTGLEPNTPYTFGVASRDAAGNTSAVLEESGRTEMGADTDAPTTPGNLQPTNVTQNAVTLTWAPSTDNTAVTAYIVYLDAVEQTRVGSTSTQLRGLSPGVEYTASVSAIDAAGNESDPATTAFTTAVQEEEQGISGTALLIGLGLASQLLD